MPYFKVKKWQSGTDAHGDDFTREHEDIVLEATSREALQKALARVDGIELYAREYLMLHIEGECQARQSVSAREFVAEYERRKS
jgi:hypothetical protein